jgi:hypothetical protein
VQHERRYPDRVEDATDVNIEVHAYIVAQRPGADTQAKDTGKRSSLVLRHVRIPEGDHFSLPDRIHPRSHNRIVLQLPLGTGRQPRQLGRAHETRHGIDQDEPLRPLRVRCGEEDRLRSALAQRTNDGPLGARSAHNSPDIVHARFERRVA